MHTFPVGVRAALNIYACRISPFTGWVVLKCRRSCATLCIGRGATVWLVILQVVPSDIGGYFCRECRLY